MTDFNPPEANADLKLILEQLLKAAAMHENSYDSAKGLYGRDLEDCLEEVTGDKFRARTLSLFYYWTNDVNDMASFMGMQLKRIEDKLVFSADVPPAPSEEHYWKDGEWQFYENDFGEVIEA